METTKPKHAGGRPRKAIKGEWLWVPGEAVALVKAVMAQVKLEQQNKKGDKK